MSAQLFTTTDGINCRPVNPFDKGPEMSSRINNDWIDFERSAPTYHIYSDKPIEAGAFEGELQYQIRHRIGSRGLNDNTKLTDWQQCSAEYYNQLTPSMDKELYRQAVQPVPVKGEEKGEEADDLWKSIYASIAYSLATAELENKPQSDAIGNATNDIYEKHTHALASSNLVELERVIEILEKMKWGAEVYLYGVFDSQITEAITQIKNLTK